LCTFALWALGLLALGLLPSTVSSLDEQAKRAYAEYQEQPTDLAKNIFMTAL
jgi:malate dehydrogenase (oxaloacetate-decarboxylating)